MEIKKAKKYKALCNHVVFAKILKERLAFLSVFDTGICIYVLYI